MPIERWELVPSSRADRYVLKVRGDRSDLDKIVRAYARVCEEPREIGDPVYQWAVYVVDASLNERLAIQDQLRDLVARPAEPDPSLTVPVDLSGVLAELSMVLEELTGLTEEEQAHVAKKMQQIQQREAEQSVSSPPPPARPAPEKPVSPAPPVVPAVSMEAKPQTALPPAPTAAPAPPPPPTPAPVFPPPPSVAPVSASPVLPPSPPQEDVPADQLIRSAFYFPEGGESAKEKFLTKLADVALKKAKKPMVVRAALSRATTISTKKSTEWIQGARSVNADCLFVILTPDILPDFMEGLVAESRLAGIHCFLIPQAEIDSRLLYVDLMVELMLIKRKK